MDRPEQTAVQRHKDFYDTLVEAVKADLTCLMECTLKSTGEKMAVICVMVADENEHVELVPTAAFLNGNPYDLFEPPKEFTCEEPAEGGAQDLHGGAQELRTEV